MGHPLPHPITCPAQGPPLHGTLPSILPGTRTPSTLLGRIPPRGGHRSPHSPAGTTSGSAGKREASHGETEAWTGWGGVPILQLLPKPWEPPPEVCAQEGPQGKWSGTEGAGGAGREGLGVQQGAWGCRESWVWGVFGGSGVVGGAGGVGSGGVFGGAGREGLSVRGGAWGTASVWGCRGVLGLGQCLGVQGVLGLEGVWGCKGCLGVQGGVRGSGGCLGVQGLFRDAGSVGSGGVGGSGGCLGVQGVFGLGGVLGVQGGVWG